MDYIRSKSVEISIPILYEDNHLIAINKPAGFLAQGDKTGDKDLISIVKEYIKVKYNKPGAVYLGLIHRLDRPVSGVLLFARTSKAMTRMSKAFSERQVDKEYLAYCKGSVKEIEGTVSNYLMKNSKENKSFIAKPKSKFPKAKKAITKYKVVSMLKKTCLLKVMPITGRSHQIRVHLAHLGIPIVGDLKYWGPASSTPSQICLHCEHITFTHPTTKESIRVSASVPKTKEWNEIV